MELRGERVVGRREREMLLERQEEGKVHVCTLPWFLHPEGFYLMVSGEDPNRIFISFPCVSSGSRSPRIGRCQGRGLLANAPGPTAAMASFSLALRCPGWAWS